MLGVFTLLLAGCGGTSEKTRVSGWTDSILDSEKMTCKQALTEVLSNKGREVSKAEGICGCFVDNASYVYSPGVFKEGCEESDTALSTEIEKLLKGCLVQFNEQNDIRLLFLLVGPGNRQPDAEKKGLYEKLKRLNPPLPSEQKHAGSSAEHPVASGLSFHGFLSDRLEKWLSLPKEKTIHHELHLLPDPVNIAKLKENEAVPGLNILELIPKQGAGILFVPLSAKSLEQRLRILADQLEDSKYVMTEEEKKTYEEAMSALYKDADQKIPTDSYALYLRLMKLKKDLLASLRDGKKDREFQLSDVEMQLKAVSRIEHALGTVETIRMRMDHDDSAAIRQKLLRSHKPVHMLYEVNRPGFGGWFLIPSENKSFTLSVSINGNSQTRTATMPAAHLSRIGCHWPSLQGLYDVQWKAHSWVLADNDPTTTSPKEVVPRVNRDILVTKDVELSFDAAVVKEIVTSVQGGSSVRIAGMDLNKDDVVQVNGTTIKITSPFVMATISDGIIGR